MFSEKRISITFPWFFMIVIILLSLFQPIVYVILGKSGFTFPLVHNYEQDYFWYLSLMEQGKEGMLAVTTRYSSEYFTPQYVNTFFPLIGMISVIFGGNLPIIYTVFRALGGGLLLIAAYRLCIVAERTILQSGFQKFALFSFISVLFVSPFFTFHNGIIRLFGEFWTGFDPLLRVTFLPHHLFSNASLIGILLIISTSSNERKISRLIVPAMLAFITGWLNPGTLGMLLVTMTLGLGIYGIQIIFKDRQCKRMVYVKPEIIATYIGGIVALALLLFIQQTTFPWTAFRDWERYQQYPIGTISFLASLGLIGVFAVPGCIVALRRKDIFWTMIASWYIVVFIGIDLLVYFIPISNGRFLQAVPYIPASLLSSLFLYTVAGRFGMMRRKFLLLMMGVIVVFGVLAFTGSLQRQYSYIEKNASNPIVYVNNDVLDALTWLSTDGNSEDVVLAPGWISILVPAYTNKRVVFGHPTFSYNGEEKMWKTYDLLNGGTASAAVQFLKENVVEYILGERVNKTLSQYYNTLGFVEVHTSGIVHIYKKQ